MNERLRSVRKKLGLNQEQFGQAIGLSNTAISKLEQGENNLTEQTLKAICREFGVNIGWLRTGEGEPFTALSEDEKITRFVGQVLRSEESHFQRRFLAALADLNAAQWALLETMTGLLSERVLSRETEKGK